MKLKSFFFLDLFILFFSFNTFASNSNAVNCSRYFSLESNLMIQKTNLSPDEKVSEMWNDPILKSKIQSAVSNNQTIYNNFSILLNRVKNKKLILTILNKINSEWSPSRTQYLINSLVNVREWDTNHNLNEHVIEYKIKSFLKIFPEKFELEYTFLNSKKSEIDKISFLMDFLTRNESFLNLKKGDSKRSYYFSALEKLLLFSNLKLEVELENQYINLLKLLISNYTNSSSKTQELVKASAELILHKKNIQLENFSNTYQTILNIKYNKLVDFMSIDSFMSLLMNAISEGPIYVHDELKFLKTELSLNKQFSLTSNSNVIQWFEVVFYRNPSEFLKFIEKIKPTNAALAKILIDFENSHPKNVVLYNQGLFTSEIKSLIPQIKDLLLGKPAGENSSNVSELIDRILINYRNNNRGENATIYLPVIIDLNQLKIRDYSIQDLKGAFNQLIFTSIQNSLIRYKLEMDLDSNSKMKLGFNNSKITIDSIMNKQITPWQMLHFEGFELWTKSNYPAQFSFVLVNADSLINSFYNETHEQIKPLIIEVLNLVNNFANNSILESETYRNAPEKPTLDLRKPLSVSFSQTDGTSVTIQKKTDDPPALEAFKSTFLTILKEDRADR